MTEHLESADILNLKEKLNSLRNELLGLLDNWHYFHSDVYQKIMFSYDNVFGDLEFEIENKSQSCDELERRVEILSLKMRKGEKLTEKTIKFVDLILEREKTRNSRTAESHFTEINKPQFETSHSQSNSNSEISDLNCEVNDKYEIINLYRQVVKKLHPDVVGETEIFKKFWDNIQNAYKSQDIDRIRLFYQTLCEEDDVQNMSDRRNAENVLKNKIHEIEQNIVKQKRKIEQLKRQEPFVFEEKLNDKLWIAQRKNKLREKLFQIDRRIHHNKRMLNSITFNVKMTKKDIPVKEKFKSESNKSYAV